MNISDASIRLTSEDIKSIIDDFVKVPGLNINEIKIDKLLYISGSFKKLVTIPFKLEVSLEGVDKHNIKLMLKKIQIAKVPVFKWIRDIALKQISKTLKEYGLTFNEGMVNLYIPALMKSVPVKLQFGIKAVGFGEDSITVELSKIKLDISDKKEEPKPEENGQVKLVKASQAMTPAQTDAYGRVRKQINSKSPEKYKELISYMMVLPDIAALLVRLFRDKRVPVKSKIICGSVIAYFALPFDILPDFIPIIGSIDDFALAFYAVNKILCDVPEEVVVENWQGKGDIVVIVRNGIKFLQKFVGVSNLTKGFRWLAKAVKRQSGEVIQEEVKEKETDGEESICS
ncbi:MAG: YkvA family protein [Bacillota bacterium]|nr:YkvA family protein [Bacillota bacterium]